MKTYILTGKTDGDFDVCDKMLCAGDCVEKIEAVKTILNELIRNEYPDAHLTDAKFASITISDKYMDQLKNYIDDMDEFIRNLSDCYVIENWFSEISITTLK